MRLLFDQNLSFKLCRRLEDRFPGSTQARLIGLDRVGDRILWDYAKEHGFVLVSLDADFAELAALLGLPPKLLWLRCGNQTTDAIEVVLRQHAQAIVSFADDAQAACLELY